MFGRPLLFLVWMLRLTFSRLPWNFKVDVIYVPIIAILNVFGFGPKTILGAIVFGV
jgi:hypothetical protein